MGDINAKLRPGRSGNHIAPNGLGERIDSGKNFTFEQELHF